MREIEILVELHTDIDKAKSVLQKFEYKGQSKRKIFIMLTR